MKVYTAQTAPWSVENDEDLVLIKEGFSWVAFFLGPIWALWHRLWTIALIVLTGYFLINLGGNFLDLGSKTILIAQFSFCFCLGLWGNDCRRWNLMRQGYVLRTVVTGSKFEDIERAYFNKLQQNML